MTYSPDGTKLYVMMTLSFVLDGPSYPVILTYETTSYSLINIAPAFQDGGQPGGSARGRYLRARL